MTWRNHRRSPSAAGSAYKDRSCLGDQGIRQSECCLRAFLGRTLARPADFPANVEAYHPTQRWIVLHIDFTWWQRLQHLDQRLHTGIGIRNQMALHQVGFALLLKALQGIVHWFEDLRSKL